MAALYPGVSGFAGELGHLTIEREGRRCRCGSQGCVEQYAGLDAILGGAGLGNSWHCRMRWRRPT
ncbi:ROK family protein [Nocardia barduliensis]|uniref:ROK family protein n=1 Tax=Nocardia barduliensis TaxID=2736643 RepID=UPI0015722545